MDGISVAARALVPFVAAIEACGVDPSSLMPASELDLAVTDEVAARIPCAAAYAFITRAVDRTGDDDLGIHAAELAAQSSGIYGIVEFLARSRATVGDCLDTLARYARLFQDDLAIDVERSPDVVTVRLTTAREARPPRAWNDFAIVSMCLSGRRFVSPATRSANLGISLPHAEPEHIDELRRLFDGEIEFGADACAIRLRSEILAQPVTTADPALAQALAPFADQLLAARPPISDFAARVRALLSDELARGAPSADGVAARLHMSTRTLWRRLAAAGTSFQNVLDELRRDLASQLLADPALAIGEVGERLGFSNTSAFNHAFRRWTGRTPGEWRQAARIGAPPRISPR